jgi:hypothetical protein
VRALPKRMALQGVAVDDLREPNELVQREDSANRPHVRRPSPHLSGRTVLFQTRTVPAEPPGVWLMIRILLVAKLTAAWSCISPQGYPGPCLECCHRSSRQPHPMTLVRLTDRPEATFLLEVGEHSHPYLVDGWFAGNDTHHVYDATSPNAVVAPAEDFVSDPVTTHPVSICFPGRPRPAIAAFATEL